ncbi:hypothetical protein E0F76_07185 [Flavobacterium cellulosilyticum]|uniref:Integrase catalytic domain-containing protein n=1 Tax=Flavobacterium cellulosilyticum TaxID=2541731 RepID=A0A4R5CFV9_9FLAO|nr:hypothetical protein E0F76_07185 [Flavobacterium cellulosilyticum]
MFKSLKTDSNDSELAKQLIYGNKLISKEQMKLETLEYIEVWYNRKRRYSTLNYPTNEEFNNQSDQIFLTNLEQLHDFEYRIIFGLE